MVLATFAETKVARPPVQEPASLEQSNHSRLGQRDYNQAFCRFKQNRKFIGMAIDQKRWQSCRKFWS